MRERVTLHAGSATAILDPVAGGRIAALTVDGLDLLLTQGDGPLTWGCYPMVPWAGRLRGGVLCWRGEEHRLATRLLPPHAIHGTLLEERWDVLDAMAGEAALAANLGPPWPFGGRAVHRVALGPTSLHAVLEVHADQPMPAIVGWHPWFPRVLRDRTGAPVGERSDVMESRQTKWTLLRSKE